MKVSENFTITKRSQDDAFYGENEGHSYVIYASDHNYADYSDLYTSMRNTPFAERPKLLSTIIKENRFPEIFGKYEMVIEGAESVEEVKEPTPTEILLRGISNLMEFFTEFSFTPSFRFTNTFAFMACSGKQDAIEYVRNYFALMDSSYAKEVEQKIKSSEFNQIIHDIAQFGAPADHINTRLKIYYGNAGTGKTTIAQEESENRCIVCNSSMLPADLMEDFIFKDGNPDFNPSLLWDCMEQGKTIVLDEINLLPFDSLRFLQGIVDGKSEFYYKNRPVHIHEGFQIIGTMNLTLGGMTYGLPEPLVDRCSVAKEFVLSAEQLAKAIMGMNPGTDGE